MAAAVYHLVDVFTDAPFTGNPLAVFPNGEEVPQEWMPLIARELNLSETAFVTGRSIDSYGVRIFTPASELPFAGHPTIGTAWVLHSLGLVTTQRLTQKTAGGDTAVNVGDGVIWFERNGTVLDQALQVGPLAGALGLRSHDIADVSWTLGGRSFRPSPTVADAGLPQVLVPIVDPTDLVRLKPSRSLTSFAPHGIYCWTVVGPGLIKARFFAPALGVLEDPATGSAAAALGVFIASHLGEVQFEISQGAEIGRPSRILVDANDLRVRVGGAVAAVGRGMIQLTASRTAQN